VKVSALPTTFTASPVPRGVGIKRRANAENGSVPSPTKRKKSAEAIDPATLTSKPPPSERVAKNSKKVKSKKYISEASKTKSKTKNAPVGSDEEEGDTGLEEAYERRQRLGEQSAPSTEKNRDAPESSSDSEVDTSQLIHETVAKGERHGKTRPTQRHVHHDSPRDETKEQRDARTIFIGNVSVEVAKSKVCPISFLARTPISHVR